MKNNENLCSLKLLHGIHDSTGYGERNITYNIVSHNFQFPFCFLDITHFIGIYATRSLLAIGGTTTSYRRGRPIPSHREPLFFLSGAIAFMFWEDNKILPQV